MSNELKWEEIREGIFEAFGLGMFKYLVSRNNLGTAYHSFIKWGSIHEDEQFWTGEYEAKRHLQSHHNAICAAIEEAILTRSGGSMPCLNCGGTGEVKHQISECDYELAQCRCCSACGNIFVIPAQDKEDA